MQHILQSYANAHIYIHRYKELIKKKNMYVCVCMIVLTNNTFGINVVVRRHLSTACQSRKKANKFVIFYNMYEHVRLCIHIWRNVCMYVTKLPSKQCIKSPLSSIKQSGSSDTTLDITSKQSSGKTSKYLALSPSTYTQCPPGKCITFFPLILINLRLDSSYLARGTFIMYKYWTNRCLFIIRICYHR